MRPVNFDREKFRELIVYIAEQTADDPWFGDTHLNKALYYSDFDGYRVLGHPVTGARYFKLPFGPGAKPLLPVRDDLADEGVVRIEEPPPGTKQARKTIPLRSAETSQFEKDELRLVDEVIARLRDQTAAWVSHASHEESVGWNLVDMYDDIPYQTALVSRESPPQKTLARARERAAQLGW